MTNATVGTVTKAAQGAVLKVIAGGSHGMCTTLKNEVSAELLAFIKA